MCPVNQRTITSVIKRGHCPHLKLQQFHYIPAAWSFQYSTCSYVICLDIRTNSNIDLYCFNWFVFTRVRKTAKSKYEFVPSFLPTFVPSFVRSFVRLFLRLFVSSFLRSFLRLFVPSFVSSFVPSFVPSFVSSLLPSLVRLFIRFFVHSFISSFVCSFLPSILRPFLHCSLPDSLPFLLLSHIPACHNVRTELNPPLKGFTWNLIFQYYSKICRENSSFWHQ